ncbi:458_t:CDS:2, partial [Racocetra persica]
ALIDKYVQEIKNKLKAAGITDKEIEILGNKKLKNAKSEEELEEALKKTRDIANNSSDEELKKQKEETERKLGEKNKQKAREIIRDEVNGVLEENGIKSEDLSTEVKQKYDELNNNIETSQAQTIRTEIFNDMGKKALEKLIAALEQAIKNKNKNEFESQRKKLQEFMNSQVDYKKSAYEKKRDEVQRLLDQAKNHSNQENSKDDGFFRLNNPLMWVSGVAAVGIVAGAVLIVRSRKRKAARNITISKREIKQPLITFRVKTKQEEPKIINLAVHLEKLTAQLSDGRELSIPIDWFAKWG